MSISLAPSEFVLLFGEQFASPARTMEAKAQVLRTGEKVSATQLALAAYTAGFLAAEQAGVIRLEARTKKTRLGLRTANVLYVVPAGGGGWPAPCFEADLPALLGGREAEPYALLYGYLGEDSSTPWNAALHRIEQGLERRGLLAREAARVLMVLKGSRIVLPESTREALTALSPEGVRQALEAFPRERPEIHRMLEAGIRRGITNRTSTTEVTTS